MKAFINTDFAKEAFGFQPIVFGWCQDWMVASKPFDEFLLGRLGGSPAEFSEHHGGVAYQTRSFCDSLLVAAGTKMVDEDRSIEDDEVTHHVPRIRAFRRISTSAS